MICNYIVLYARSGRNVIVFTWAAIVMILRANTFWVVVSFMEFKTWSLVLKRRMTEQRGDYLSVFKEMKDNLVLGPKIDRVLMGTSFRGSISEPYRPKHEEISVRV